MSKYLLLFILIFCFCKSYSQKDSIICKVDNQHLARDVWEFMNFDGISYFKVSLIGEKVKNRQLIIRSKEYWLNTEVKIDTLIHIETYDSTEYDFNVFSKKLNSDSVRLGFYFITTTRFKNYKILKSDLYRLTTGKKRNMTISLNEYIPVLAYSLPKAESNNKDHYSWCSLTKDGVLPELWSEKFGIKHYIVFELKIE